MHDNRRVRPRFYTPNLRTDGKFPLPTDEAHHALRVLRLASGDEVEVFDGRGNVYRAVVAAAGRNEVSVHVTDQVTDVADLPLVITVVQAVLKGRSMDDAVRDATMMGAARIQPVIADHVVVKAAAAMREENRDRWGRVALAAVKQSRRSVLPVIMPVLPAAAVLTAAAAGERLIFVEPAAAAPSCAIRSLAVPAAGAVVTVLLGPEGGWSSAELAAAASSGWTAVTLGPLTMRAESMPVAALAAIWAIWGR